MQGRRFTGRSPPSSPRGVGLTSAWHEPTRAEEKKGESISELKVRVQAVPNGETKQRAVVVFGGNYGRDRLHRQELKATWSRLNRQSGGAVIPGGGPVTRNSVTFDNTILALPAPVSPPPPSRVSSFTYKTDVSSPSVQPSLMID
ncbi:hypothetical protein OS493_028552 [Desmophyllum pertusum]|uniref:Uncharacterized protein n=1 Tax=Desmophyllum pertusum TaxID=174260 RepID=A0A9W9YWV8_9CNID|nr:hypothetical protein OS493_028552 [Desmophyllum pertusum]